MIVTAEYVRPEQYEIELTIRMSFKDWSELREQLMQKWPSGKLGDHIASALSKLTRQVIADSAEQL